MFKFSIKGTLDKLVKRVERARDAATEKAAKEAMRLVQDGFSRAQDPYGIAWAGKASYANPTLQDTGLLRHGFNYKISGLFITIENVVAKYGKYHQAGTLASRGSLHRRHGSARVVGVPMRRMLPTTELGVIPPGWKTIVSVYKKEFWRKALS